MNFFKSRPVIVILAALFGALVILVIRFATYSIPSVHYHANFAVYINGSREQFSDPSYYQEVSACSALDTLSQPIQRAHMHDNVNSVIHVHDHAVTWGQFFANLGWELGPNLLEDKQGHLYVDNGTERLNLMLNGHNLTGSAINNAVIHDQDRLLVSYGAISAATLKEEYSSVPATAKHYDETKDPASCSGTETTTWSDRLHHLF